MSDNDKCPKCGAGVTVAQARRKVLLGDNVHFVCGAFGYAGDAELYDLFESRECLRRQLAQSKARNAALLAVYCEVHEDDAPCGPCPACAAVFIDDLVTLLRKLQWTYQAFRGKRCPICDHWEIWGHAPDCKLKAALEKGNGH